MATRAGKPGEASGRYLAEAAKPGHAGQQGCGRRWANALERPHEACFARACLALLQMRRNLDLKRRQVFAEARNMRLEAAVYARMAGMFEPVGFGE